MKLKSKSFTLIEVLLVSVLISVIGLAVFKCFANGLKLWSRAQKLNSEIQVAIFLDKFSDDLRSSINFSGLDFKGSETRFSFPAMVRTTADPKSSRSEEGFIYQIGKLEYSYDYSQHAIYRRQSNYSQALKGNWQNSDYPEVLNIDKLEFLYDIPSEKGFLLKSEIKGGNPVGVVINIKFSDESGTHQINRYLSIPAVGQ